MLKTEGIVIKEIKYGETSKILNIYTREEGKISVLVKGAYNPKSRLIANTQTFSINDFQFKRGRNFYYINQADLLDSHYSIREDLERMAYGYYMLELLDKSVELGQKNESLFSLLRKGLKILENLSNNYLKFIIGYELKHISFLGYRPLLNRCLVCSQELTGLNFSCNHGGIICNGCLKSNMGIDRISKEMYRIICESLYSPLEDLKNIEGDISNFKKVHNLLLKYILINIDRKEFNSLDLIKEINGI